MRYNIHSFMALTDIYHEVDVTTMAHNFLAREYSIDPVFYNLDEAKQYAREAAQFIATKWHCNMISYCVSGFENDKPSLEIRKADFYEKHTVIINSLEDE